MSACRPPESLFPLALDLRGCRVLVAGGGPVALAHARRLLEAGAIVQVVTQDACEPLRVLAAAGELDLAERKLDAADLDGIHLCIVVAGQPDSDDIAAKARAAGVLVSITPEARGLAEPRAGGRASLVGTGPGDAELLTLRAVDALRHADVVLYDALIDPAILGLAPRDARRIDVGKRCGRHAMNQAAINRLIVENARRGAHVVRLKGGDPMVFGRAGEELASLRAAGVPVEVIPGVTAACAAAASLGVSLTHRGAARSLHLVTGHGSDGALPVHDWGALVRSGGTIAAYMAGRTLPDLAAALMEAGLPGATPAAAVESACQPAERQIRTTLAQLPAALAAAAVTGPVMVLIGAAIGLAASEVMDAADARLVA